MASPLLTETNLIGYLSKSVTSTATSIEVKFYDKVTGEARTPDAGTLLFVIDKGSQDQPNPNYEIILATSHSTASGVTTLASVTRGLAFSGNSLAAVSANQKAHVANAEIGCVDAHYLWTLTNKKVAGDEAFDADITIDSGTKILFGGAAAYVFSDDSGTNLKFKDGSNSEITLSTLAAAAGADEKIKITASDTTNGYLGAKLTGGDGINTTVINPAANESLDLDIDLTDTNVFKAVSAGVADAGKAVALDADGYVDQDSVQLIKDVTSTAAELNKLDGAGATVTAANLDSLTDDSELTDLHFHKRTSGRGNKSISTSAETTTQDVAHGLGVEPNWIKLKFNSSFPIGGGSVPSSDGVYDGTNEVCLYVGDGGASATGGNNNTVGYIFYDDVNSKIVTITITATDSTNFTISYNSSAGAGNPDAQTLYYTWETGI